MAFMLYMQFQRAPCIKCLLHCYISIADINFPSPTLIKGWSFPKGQGPFLVSVKQSRTIFKLGNCGQDVYVLHVHIAQSVVKCVVKWSRSHLRCGQVVRQKKNNNRQFLTLVAAVTIAPMGVTTPC